MTETSSNAYSQGIDFSKLILYQVRQKISVSFKFEEALLSESQGLVQSVPIRVKE